MGDIAIDVTIPAGDTDTLSDDLRLSLLAVLRPSSRSLSSLGTAFAPICTGKRERMAKGVRTVLRRLNVSVRVPRVLVGVTWGLGGDDVEEEDDTGESRSRSIVCLIDTL
jgi:hypothetical protein